MFSGAVTALIALYLEYHTGLFISKTDRPATEGLGSRQVADQVARQTAEVELLRQEVELKRLRFQIEHATADSINARREHEVAIGELRRQFACKQEAEQVNFQARMAEIRKEAHEGATRLTRVEQELARREREVAALRGAAEEAKQQRRQAEDELAERLNSRGRAESNTRRYYSGVTINGERIPRE
jgi:hypothetical protein